MRWDPLAYASFTDERSRPFYELVARIGAEHPRRVVDLGCGPGNLTAALAQRWPDAEIVGIDSSPEMIERARQQAGPRVRFELGDAGSWVPEADVVVSNAALQWLPGHDAVVRGWLATLPAGAWVAWQVPDNLDEPSHALMREVATDPRWRDALADIHRAPVPSPQAYARLILDAGWRADVWRTSYVHVLSGEDPVLEWVRGTGLRPYLQALDPDDATAFEAEYAARLRRAYPAVAGRTLLPFPRTFAVAHRPSPA